MTTVSASPQEQAATRPAARSVALPGDDAPLRTVGGGGEVAGAAPAVLTARSGWTFIIPDDVEPCGPFTFEGIKPIKFAFNMHLDRLPRPKFITVKDVTNGIEYQLPVLPCGCVGECACSASETRETMLLSEPALAREWDTPEEDAAWKDL